MGNRLSADERKQIDQMDERGSKATEIANKIGIDTRTVKNYLTERPRERSVELERQQEELNHRNDLRNRIIKLKEKLKFPAPESLDITDLSREMIAYNIGTGNIMRWRQAADGNYLVKLDDEFTPILEHLHSSRRKVILNILKEWQRIGGKCIVDCYLRQFIQKEAEEQTKLRTIPENIVEGKEVRSNVREGLLEGFSWTIYRWALCNTEEEKYITVSEIKGLHLLHWGMYNLAWVKDNDIERIKDIHRRLIVKFQKLSTTRDILEGKKKLDLLAESTRRELDEFASLSMLPGKCRLCPGK